MRRRVTAAMRHGRRLLLTLVGGCAIHLALVGSQPSLAQAWYKPPQPRRIDTAVLGDPRAQAYLGYMYAQGLGVEQNQQVSANWYRCAAVQGYPHAQFLLGLMYDKAQGVPQDFVRAYAWTNKAVAHAPRGLRKDWVRVRDAISGKLSLIERSAGQNLAILGPPEPPCDEGLWLKP